MIPPLMARTVIVAMLLVCFSLRPSAAADDTPEDFSSRMATRYPAEFGEYTEGHTAAYRSDSEFNSRRTPHFIFQWGPASKDGCVTEQLAQGHMQMLEHSLDNWRAQGLYDLGGTDADHRYKLTIFPGNTFAWDGPSGAVSYGNGPALGIHVPASALAWETGNGCTPHECGHGWQNSAAGLPFCQPPGWTESLANWYMGRTMVGYPGNMLTSGLTANHLANSYNHFHFFTQFMDDPRFGAPFINRLIADPNKKTLAPADQYAARDGDPHAADDIVRKAIRVNRSGAVDPAAEIYDAIGMMNAKLLDSDFWNKKWDTANRHDADARHEYFHFYRATMVRQPGVEGGWYRPQWNCIPQQLGNHFVPLTVTAKGARRVVSCEFRPVSDAYRGTTLRACLVAFNRNKEPRYSRVWNAGVNTFALAEDEDAVYLTVIAAPKILNGDQTHVDLTGDKVAMMPYRARFSGAQPREFAFSAPTTATHKHANGGGVVADTASVDATAYVGANAMVLDAAKVHGNSRIEDYAVIDKEAVIGRPGQMDDPVVSGHAYVTDKAQVFGHARVREHAWLMGEAKAYGSSLVMSHSVMKKCEVFGSAVICQSQVRDTYLTCEGKFSGSAIRGGDISATNGEDDKSTWLEFPKMSVADNKFQYVGYNFEKTSAIFAMDQHGMNHGYLMGDAQVVPDAIRNIPTHVLALDGKSRYVELKPDAVDFPEVTIAAWVKWTGSEANQMVWSFGDGMKKMMGLTPKGKNGKLRFAISDGKTSQVLDGRGPLAANVWTHVAVTLAGNKGALYVDGVVAARNADMRLNPDQLHAPLMADANYLGRGNQAGWFAGNIDEFRIYNKALDDAEVAALPKEIAAAKNAADAPDASAPTAVAAWRMPPTLDGRFVVMSAVEAADPHGVLYYFHCVDDERRDSGWISEPRYVDCAAPADKKSTYSVKIKDILGNTSAESVPKSVAVSAPGMTLPKPSFARPPKGDSATSIAMSAAKASDGYSLVQYQFTRAGAAPVASGWSSSPTWTDTGLTEGKSYDYTLQLMDETGKVSAAAQAVSATARDDTPPIMEDLRHKQWNGEAIALLDRRIRMAAREPVAIADAKLAARIAGKPWAPQDVRDVDYWFECVEKPAINSGWISDVQWISPPMPDGPHSFRHKLRDRSPQHNESEWSLVSCAKVLATNSYHDHKLAELKNLPDSTLVRFSGKVTRMLPQAYEISDPKGSSIQVSPRSFDRLPDATLLGREVTVEGHLWTYQSQAKMVTYAIVLPAPLDGRIEFENGRLAGEASVTYKTEASAQEFVTLRYADRPASVELPHFAAAKRIELTGRTVGPLEIHVNGSLAAKVELNGNDQDPLVTKGFDVSIPADATLRFVVGPGCEARLDCLFVGETFPVSGKVTDLPGIRTSPAAVRRVFFAPTADTLQRPSYTAFVDAKGEFRKNLPAGSWHALAVTDDPIRVKQSQTRELRLSGKTDGIDFQLQPLPGRTGKIEAETGLLIGPFARKSQQVKASGGMDVSDLWGDGGGVEFVNVAAAKTLKVAYSSNVGGDVTYSLYVNGKFDRKVHFQGTGTWDKYKEISLAVDIPDHATLRFQKDAGDAPWNLDYLILAK